MLPEEVPSGDEGCWQNIGEDRAEKTARAEVRSEVRTLMMMVAMAAMVIVMMAMVMMAMMMMASVMMAMGNDGDVWKKPKGEEKRVDKIYLFTPYPKSRTTDLPIWRIQDCGIPTALSRIASVPREGHAKDRTS